MSIVLRKPSVLSFMFLDEADPEIASILKEKCQRIFQTACLSIPLNDPGIKYAKVLTLQARLSARIQNLYAIDASHDKESLGAFVSCGDMTRYPSLCQSFFQLIVFYWNQESKGKDLCYFPLKDAQTYFEYSGMTKVVKVHAFSLLLLKKIQHIPFVFTPIFYYFFEGLEHLSLNYLMELDRLLKCVDDRHGEFIKAIIQCYIKEKKADFCFSLSCEKIAKLAFSLRHGGYQDIDIELNLLEKAMLFQIAKPEHLSLDALVLAPKGDAEAIYFQSLPPAMKFLGMAYLVKKRYRGELQLTSNHFENWAPSWIKQLFCLAVLNEEYPFINPFLELIANAEAQSHELTFLLNHIYSNKIVTDEALVFYFHNKYLQTLPLDRLEFLFKSIIIHQRDGLLAHFQSCILIPKAFLQAQLVQAINSEDKDYIKALFSSFHHEIDDKTHLTQLFEMCEKKEDAESTILFKQYYPYFLKTVHDCLLLNKYGLERYQHSVGEGYLFTYLSLLLQKGMVELYEVVFERYAHDVEDTDLRYLACLMIQKNYLEMFYRFYNSIPTWQVDEVLSFIQELRHLSPKLDETVFLHPCIQAYSDDDFSAFLEDLFKKIGKQGHFYAYFFLKMPFSERQYRTAFELIKNKRLYGYLYPFKFCRFITQNDWDETLLEMIAHKATKELRGYADLNYPKLSLAKYSEAKALCGGSSPLEEILEFITIGSIYKQQGIKSEFSTHSFKLDPISPLFDPKFALNLKLKAKARL